MKEPSEAARAVNLEQRNKKESIIIVMAIVIMSSIRRIVDNKVNNGPSQHLPDGREASLPLHAAKRLDE